MAKTVSITYQGASDGVEIAETGQWAERGKSIEVDAEVAERLLRAGLPEDDKEAAKVPKKDRTWVKGA